jgi:hypothetical protein
MRDAKSMGIVLMHKEKMPPKYCGMLSSQSGWLGGYHGLASTVANKITPNAYLVLLICIVILKLPADGT